MREPSYIHGSGPAEHLDRQSRDISCYENEGADALSGPVPHIERLEDTYLAKFRLKLAGEFRADRKKAPTSSEEDTFLIEHSLAALKEHQRLAFLIRRNAQGQGNPAAELFVEGSEEAGASDEAEHGARGLGASVVRLLSLRNDLSFEEVEPSQDVDQRTYCVEPCGVLVTTEARPQSQTAHQGVILPAPSYLEHRVDFWETLLRSDYSFEVEVSFSRLELNATTLQSIADVYSELNSTKLRCQLLPAGEWLNREQVSLVRANIESHLTRWLTVPRGLAVSITFRTATAESTDAMRAIAQTILPMRRMEVVPSSSRGTVQGNAIDLRHLLNEARIVPALLPGPHIVDRLDLGLRFRPPRTRMASGGLLLGRAGEQKVFFPDQDRDRHCYIVGATGSGKSTLLLNMIRQDVQAGQGLAVICPHGDLYRDVLASIPRSRADDVVLFDPTDLRHAAGINYLEVPGDNPRFEHNFVVNELMKIFDRLYDLKSGCGGPMFEQYMRNALLLLCESSLPGMTLTEVPLLFESSEFRKVLVRHCTSPAVKRFWTHQAEKARGDGSLENLAPYITSKLNQFTHNYLVRTIIGQSRSTIDFQNVMNEKKILLVNLSRGVLGEYDSALLGMLVISKLFLAALARAKLPTEKRPAFNLFVDEFQLFTTDTVAQLLSEARKFNLRCVFSNQFLRQVDTGAGAGNILRSILGNVATILAMRISGYDAEVLDGILGRHISSATLQNLPDFHAAARMMQHGRPIDPFVFETLPPRPLEADPEAQRIIYKNYLNKYTVPSSAVETQIAERADLASNL